MFIRHVSTKKKTAVRYKKADCRKQTEFGQTKFLYSVA